MSEWEYAVVSCVSAATTTINDVPTVVKGYYINTALSAHQASFVDGTTAVFKTKASMGVADAADVDGTRFETNCLVVCGASMTGNFTVLYRDLERS